MLLTKENAKEIAKRMSSEMDGELVIVSVDFKMDIRTGRLNNGPQDWKGESAKDPLPVKTTNIQLMWSCGGWVHMAPYGEAHIEFPAPGVVGVEVLADSGQKCYWVFVWRKTEPATTPGQAGD